MSTIQTITTGEQTVNATGPVPGTLDTSGITGDYTVCARIRGLGPGQKLKLAIEDTVDGTTPFSEATAVAVFDVDGSDSNVASGANASEGVTFKLRSYDMPSTRIGVANAKMRANVKALSGGSAEVEAWLDV